MGTVFFCASVVGTEAFPPESWVPIAIPQQLSSREIALVTCEMFTFMLSRLDHDLMDSISILVNIPAPIMISIRSLPDIFSDVWG